MTPVPRRSASGSARIPANASRYYLGQYPDGTPGKWPALVSRETFDAINGNGIVPDPRKAPKGKLDPLFPLVGHVFCACGSPLTPSRNRKKGIFYYERARRPRSAQTPGCVRIRREELHERNEKLLGRVRFLSDLSTWRADIMTACADSAALIRTTQRKKDAELASLRDQQEGTKEAVKKAKSSGLIEMLSREFDQRETRIAEVVRQLGECESELASLAADTDREATLVERLIQSSDRLWAEGTLDDRKALMRWFFPEGVTLWNSPTGRKLQTPVTTPIVALIPEEMAVSYDVIGAGSQLASPTGFEPVFQP